MEQPNLWVIHFAFNYFPFLKTVLDVILFFSKTFKDQYSLGKTIIR